MNKRFFSSAFALTLFVSLQSNAYQIRVDVTAGSIQDPAVVQQSVNEVDGATFASLDTGLVQGTLTGNPEASALGSVDLVTGKIRLAGTARGFSGFTNSDASASFEDTLTFSVAPGIGEVTVGVVMDIEGTATPGPTFGTGGARLFASLQAIVPSAAPSIQIRNVGKIRVEVPVTDGTMMRLVASMLAGCSGIGEAETCSYDLSNTASVALEPLPEGVTFTSDGGFNEVVPVPAALWLFGSALGILGWMRRK